MKNLIEDILDREDEGVSLERECALSDVCVYFDAKFHYTYKLHIWRITDSLSQIAGGKGILQTLFFMLLQPTEDVKKVYSIIDDAMTDVPIMTASN